MRKIFTLICGMLLISVFAAQAQTVPAFPKSLDVSLSDDIEGVVFDTEYFEGIFVINVSGKSVKSSITVTVTVPDGWDGFVAVNGDDFDPGIGGGPLKASTRADEDEEPAELIPVDEIIQAGGKLSNSLTFAVGDYHYGQFMLVLGDQACVNHQINVEFEVEYDAEAAGALFAANQKAYEEAVAEIKEKNPDFDLTESAAGSGVAGVAVDDNASYYDLNGHKINRSQAGMYIKILDGKSSKVVIK